MPPSVSELLENSRRELVGVGLRGNTLLNWRPGVRNMEVIDEIAHHVYSILVTKSKSMSFRPVPQDILNKAEEEGDSTPPLPVILEERFGDGRHTDTHLQTKLSADVLDKKLIKINAEAKSFYQEQGIDILYLALGFLTWYESPASEKPRKAPLVLVPVELERKTAQNRFKVVYTKADLGTNLSLKSKLASEFQLVLPEFNEDIDIGGYMKQVANCVAHQQRWKVNENEMALGPFSFSRLQIYQDLDSKNWPENSKPDTHEVIRKLLGKGFTHGEGEVEAHVSHGAKPAVDEAKPAVPSPTALHFIQDADSSQTEAAIEVKQGSHLVIQGPPGTGKSQTITNIIAEAIADDKTVLFVAEKMAALEVVKRRLDQCGIGDAALELHSHKSNKREVVAELKRTLDASKDTKSKEMDTHRRTYSQAKSSYEKKRKSLNEYCQLVNKSILASETSFISAVGHSLKLHQEIAGHDMQDLDIPDLHQWKHHTFLEASSLVKELGAHLAKMKVPPQHHTFALAKLKEISPDEKEKIVNCLVKAKELLAKVLQYGRRRSEEMKLDAPKDIAEIEALCRIERCALDIPTLKDIDLAATDWLQYPEQVRELLSGGAEIAELESKCREQLIPQAWQADVLSTRQAWAGAGNHWWRFLSGNFRRAKQALRGLLKCELPASAGECVALLDDILRHQELSKRYAELEYLGRNLFGVHWRDRNSNWKELQKISDWVIGLYEWIGGRSGAEGVINFLDRAAESSNRKEPLENLEQVATSIEGFKNQINEVLQHLDSTLSADGEPSIEKQALEHLEKLLNDWHEHIDTIYDMARYNSLRQKLCESQLIEIAQVSYYWTGPPDLLLTLFRKTWYDALVKEAYRENKILSSFDRVAHENIISDFRGLDKELLHYTRIELAQKHYRSLLDIDAAEGMGVVRREISKKQRHKPLRKLLKEAGHAIQQIKPIFMMSPISVASYLEQGELDFDLVVFDEASQMRVAEALGSILRGKQIVVVGDERQMPPTDFFHKHIELEEDEEEDTPTANIESILSMFRAKNAPEYMLRWHYRSRHDSLIAVSNRLFYDNRLMIPPSPGVHLEAIGLELSYLPDSIYDRGKSRTNPIEARKVAEEVMHHARARPGQTLGVVAFSTAQRDCILLELERLRREDTSCEEFFGSNTKAGEDFFIKNLENVQGDERDVIYISIGYGRTASGKVTGSFGPINFDGGERRLNVLFTRARLAMRVFSNFRADEMQVRDNSREGVKALREFLHFAENREFKHSQETGKPTDSPFEDEVISAISTLGYGMEPQLGSEGFYIDIAVRDSNKPSRYILAVECDGASYHSSASARDRDRIRQDVLEGMGWRFHRIWSTDWFRTRDREVKRLKDSIEKAVNYYESLDREREASPAPREIPSAPSGGSSKEPSPQPKEDPAQETLRL